MIVLLVAFYDRQNIPWANSFIPEPTGANVESSLSHSSGTSRGYLRESGWDISPIRKYITIDGFSRVTPGINYYLTAVSQYEWLIHREYNAENKMGKGSIVSRSLTMNRMLGCYLRVLKLHQLTGSIFLIRSDLPQTAASMAFR
jgi:hypothetical protein